MPSTTGEKWLPSQEDKLREMWKAGKPDSEIAATLRMSLSRVGRKRRKIGLLSNHYMKDFESLTQTLTLSLPTPLYKTFSAYALTRHLSRSRVCQLAIQQYMKANPLQEESKI